MARSQSLCFQGWLLTHQLKADQNITLIVSIPLFSGLVTDSSTRLTGDMMNVSIPLFSGLVTDRRCFSTMGKGNCLNPFVFRAGY